MSDNIDTVITNNIGNYHMLCKDSIEIASLGIWEEGIIKSIKIIKNSKLSKKIMNFWKKKFIIKIDMN